MNQEANGFQGEISLVDLATILVRRIWLFFVLFVLFAVGGVVISLVLPEQYEYVSLYQIAEKETNEPVEKPENSVAVLESQKLPELAAAYKAERGEKLPFTIRFQNPEDTSLIRITSEAMREDSADVTAIHEALLGHIQNRHEALIDGVRGKLQTRIASVKRTLEALRETPDAGPAVAEVMQKQVELEGELAALTSGEVLVVGRESVERVAPNRKLIAILAVVLGFIFALIAVYFVEFASLVKRALREPKHS